MKSYTAMRHLSRPSTISQVNPSRRQCSRQLGMMQAVRKVQDGLGVAIGLCDTVTGRPLATILPKELVPVLQTVTGQGVSTNGASTRGFRASAQSTAPSWHVAPPSPPTTDINAPNAPPERLRAVMRLLSQSVVVCAAAGVDGIPRAMTMSSFTSLTLRPTPVITFNVAMPSRTLDAITASRQFNIHILSGDAGGAAVADHFTRGNNRDASGDDLLAGLEEVVLEKDGHWASLPSPPMLRGCGVVYVLRCRLLQDEPARGLIRVRDHMIVVGEVVEMMPGVESSEFGLAYADRKYRQVGSVISND